jgi:hypothetical protein
LLNSNKRAITLNLKHERGRALLFEMARRADVLLENFSPGMMDWLGVGWAELDRVRTRRTLRMMCSLRLSRSPLQRVWRPEPLGFPDPAERFPDEPI